MGKNQQRRRGVKGPGGDPRRYQVTLNSAMEFEAEKPGECFACHDTTVQRRHRFTVFDSGLMNHLAARDGERHEEHAERAMVEMNRRQREGDFGTVPVPRLLCDVCAMLTCYTLASLDGLDDGDDTFARTLILTTVARLQARPGALYWVGFGLLGEPGADEKWKVVAPSGYGVLDPERVYREIRREVEVHGMSPYSEPRMTFRPD